MRQILAAAVLFAVPALAQSQPVAQPAPEPANPVAEPTTLSPVTDPSITERPPVKPIKMKKIVLVGDSTTQPNSGWGGSFCALHVNMATACVNLGRGGRSTYSYRAEGAWDFALHEMEKGPYSETYVLIQFGHNDMPGKAGRSTNLETEFPANLRQYVLDARKVGAVPVLLTPLTIRSFSNGRLNHGLDPWAEKVRAVAKEMNVPLVDLYARSHAAVQGLGPVESLRLAEVAPPEDVHEAAKAGNSLPSSRIAKPVASKPIDPTGPQGSFSYGFDYTHVGRTGADYFSAIVADGLVRAVPALSRDILP